MKKIQLLLVLVIVLIFAMGAIAEPPSGYASEGDHPWGGDERRTTEPASDHPWGGSPVLILLALWSSLMVVI